MHAISDLQLFVRVADTGSMSEVARQMSLTPAAASAAIKRLEAGLEATLFERSTRSLRLTQAGESFLGYCRQALELLDEGRASVKQGRENLEGMIHVAAPSDLARNVLRDAFNQFQSRYPGITLTLLLSDSMQNLYREHIDLSLRYGQLQDSSLVARKLADNRVIACASPAYLTQHGSPTTPAELASHNCLRLFRNGQLHSHWRFVRDGVAQDIEVSGDRAANDGALVKQWAMDGVGITFKSLLDIRAELASNKLVDLFPAWQQESYPLYAVMPSRQYQPARVRALVDFLAAHFTS
ncbi:MAG: LysR family transcriptional regulator [Moraxellaceae bacterium]